MLGAAAHDLAGRRPAPRAGLDALLDAIENLQGAPLPASIFETEILAARVEGYNPADLDALTAAGEVVWCGVEPLGERDGRLALYLTDHLAAAASRARRRPSCRRASRRSLAHLDGARRVVLRALHEAAGGGYPGETVDALWDLVWKGLVTNDTFHALRAFTRPPARRSAAPTPRGSRAARPAPRAVPQPAGRAAVGRRPLVAARAAGRRADGLADRVVHGDGPAAALALRRRHPRGRRGRRRSPADSAPSTTC